MRPRACFRFLLGAVAPPLSRWRRNAYRTSILFTFAALSAQTQGEPAAAPEPYAPAYYTGLQGRPAQLVLFPSSGKSAKVDLPLPTLPRVVAFAREGNALFAVLDTNVYPRTAGRSARLGAPRLVRIGLAPVSVTTLADLAGLAWVAGLALSPGQDAILMVAAGWEGHAGCDLFAIGIDGQNLHMVRPDFGCSLDGASPDGASILVRRGLGLDIVDLATWTATPLGDGLWKAAWSPDGKWIAALQLDPRSDTPRPRRSRTILINAANLAMRRDMGGGNDEEVVWSPDSRFMLYGEWSARCPGHSPRDPGASPITLFRMDIRTGKREPVKESVCRVNSHQIGWVSSDVVPRNEVPSPARTGLRAR
jgi:hypothetical protein